VPVSVDIGGLIMRPTILLLWAKLLLLPFSHA